MARREKFCRYRFSTYIYQFVRLLNIQRFENLNIATKFSSFLIGVNEPTIEEYIKKIGLPHTAGTHVEILVIATLYEIAICVCNPTISEWLLLLKPLKANEVSHPVILSGTLPSEYQHGTWIY